MPVGWARDPEGETVFSQAILVLSYVTRAVIETGAKRFTGKRSSGSRLGQLGPCAASYSGLRR